MFLPFVRKKLRDIFQKALYYTTDIFPPFFKYRRRKNVPAFKKARTSRSADIEIWRISKHSRCPDTRRFWEYPKPFITLLSTVWVEKACLGTYRWSAVPALWLQGLNLQLFRKRGGACTCSFCTQFQCFQSRLGSLVLVLLASLLCFFNFFFAEFI